MNYNLSKNLLIIILLIVIGILFYMWNDSRNKEGEQHNLVESLNTELHVWKGKDSLNRAKIQIIETQRAKDFLAIKANDSLIAELQETVKDFSKYLKEHGNVTVIENTTDVNTTTGTEVIPKDTIVINNKEYIYPEYRSRFNLDGWVTGKVTANKDTTLLNLKVKNAYSVVVGEESNGLFKRKKPFVEVINKNPFTETTALRAYEVSMPKPKRIGIGPMIGIGLTADGVVQGTIGIGIQYIVIKF